MSRRSGGIYVHIPFCVRKCRYCDFISYPASCYAETMGRYLQAIIDELHLREAELEQVRPIQTIYIGGGTPTCVPWQELAAFTTALVAEVMRINSSGKECRCSHEEVLEVTVEANPGTVDPCGLAALRSGGANRLSIGFQSLDAAELASLGRVHSPDDCIRAYDWARQAGFDNINVDLILGAPRQTSSSLVRSLDAVMSLGPDHISAYCLSLEDGTPLARDVASGVETVPNDDCTADAYEWLVSQVEARGYVRYEISNFATPGFESAHNIGYWTCGDYVGLGVAAHSHLRDVRQGSVRSWNVKSVDDYITLIAQGLRPVAGLEERTSFEEAQDRLMLGLRMSEGVDLVSIGSTYETDLLSEYGHSFEDLAEKGLVEFSEGRVKLTPKGFLLGNLVFAECVGPRAGEQS